MAGPRDDYLSQVSFLKKQLLRVFLTKQVAEGCVKLFVNVKHENEKMSYYSEQIGKIATTDLIDLIFGCFSWIKSTSSTSFNWKLFTV